MSNPRIYLSSPHLSGQELPFVHEAFATNWVSPLGPNVDAFEAELGAYTGVGHVAALSSGTAAIHLALILLGVGPGDAVLCPTFTFSATANPILYQGATPIFVDSEAQSWNMDPGQAERAIAACVAQGRLPKALLVVHLYGGSAQMPEIMALASRYSIPVIEDAAEALGSTYQEHKLGSFGQLGILSFNGNKIITTSGGGALLSNEKDLIDKSRFLATQARDPAPHYQHSEVGYNYRLSNVLAGIGRGQLAVIEDRVTRRRENFAFYQQAFSDLPIAFQPELAGSRSNRWLTGLVLEENRRGVTRETLRLALAKENIEARPLWKPLHLQPIFEKFPYYGTTVAEDLFNRGLCLPSGSNLTAADLERVAAGVKGPFN